MNIAAILLVAALASPITASAVAAPAPACRTGEPDKAAAEKAMDVVAALPEVVALRHGLQEPLRLAFAMLRRDAAGGRCGIAVPVYVDHPERLELRATFFVDDTTAAVTHAVDPTSGDYVALAAWRRDRPLD